MAAKMKLTEQQKTEIRSYVLDIVRRAVRESAKDGQKTWKNGLPHDFNATIQCIVESVE